MSLEKNIERIADALEIIAKAAGVSPVAEGAAVTRQEVQQASVQPSARQVPQGNWQGQPFPSQQLPQGGPVPVSPPAGTGIPWPGGGGTAQPSAPCTVPTTASAKQYTFDQLAVATANLASAGKDVFNVLGRFGVGMLMDLPQEKYGEYAAALREAGAGI